MNKDNPFGGAAPRARSIAIASLVVLVALLAGCAHNNPRDPLEPFNRGMYAFNDAVDSAVLKPVATGYQAVLPQFVRTGVGNFFSNLDDVTVVINDILQLKIVQALSDTGRFVLNTTIGILGLIDVATYLGLEKHNEDFGQTLGYWGIGNGPYLVLPIFGPSSLRDGVGRFVDSKTDLVRLEDHVRTRNRGLVTRAINNRARVLESEKVIDTAAIDRYAFVRDAYLQRRRNLVHDGNPPPDPDEDDANSKPRSEAPAAEPVTTLVDSLGNPVGGTVSSGSDTPSQTRGTMSTARDDAIPGGAPAPAERGATATPHARPVEAKPRPVSEGSVDAAPDPSEQIRIVRVWLPGAASR